MELELKAEQGCTWVRSEVHLWHVGQPSGDTALCELRLDHAVGTRPVDQWDDISPERLCPVCRRRYGELLPLGDAAWAEPA